MRKRERERESELRESREKRKTESFQLCMLRIFPQKEEGDES
jgi:hypothetical protein